MYDEARIVTDFIGGHRRGSSDNLNPREHDKALLEVIKECGVNFDEETLSRLLLLDTRRRSNHQIDGAQQSSPELSGTDQEGREIKKKIDTHLRHSMNVVKVVDDFSSIFDVEWQKKYLSKIKYAGLVHDIGKTGPADADPETQKVFVILFSLFEPDYQKAREFKNTTIKEAVSAHALDSDKKIITPENLAKLGLTENDPMSKVFGQHVDNTYQILKEIPDMDPEVLFLAASHHQGLSNYQHQLTQEDLDRLLPQDQTAAEELRDAATMLELADIYEAKTSRGQQKPKQEVLEGMLKEFTEKNKTREANLLQRICEKIGK